MSKLKKIIVGGVAVFALGVGSLVTGAFMRYDRQRDAPDTDLTHSEDPEVITRGEYLVWGPAHCAGCHGAVDQIAAYEERGERIPLTGGFVIPLPLGEFTIPNITQDEETGIGAMSDAQLVRALRYGVSRHGTMLFPIMPFTDLSDEDLVAVISYLRTVEGVKQARPGKELNLLGKMLYAYVMEPVGPSGPSPKSVKREVSVDYGRYLAKNVANCYGCHTNRNLETGEFFGEPMGGGLELPHNGKVFTVPNITVGGEGSRLKDWDEAGFIARIRTAKPSTPGSPMPWAPVATMTDDDLKAIWAYLASVEPVNRDTGPALK